MFKKALILTAVFCAVMQFAGAADLTWKFQQFAVGNKASGTGFDPPLITGMTDIIQLNGGTYRMYYAVGALPPNATPSGASTAIKSATSTDGINWTVESGFRLLGANGKGTDGVPVNEGIINGARVVQLSNGSFRMYYQASTSGSNPADFRVKSATSTDGLTWTREGTRIDIDASNPNPAAFSLAAHCAVIRFSDTDYVIMVSGNYQKANTFPSDLVIGTSTDGLTFSNFRVLYANYHDPCFLKMNDGSGYRLFCGNLLLRQRTAFSSDGKTWPAQTDETILLDSSGNEVTEASTESVGDRDALELPSGEILMYETWGNPTVAGDSDIALMRQLPEINSALTATGTQGQAFTYTVGVNDLAGASFSSPALPNGLALNATTGVISGTPTDAGMTSITLTASNSFGSDTETLALTLAPASGTAQPPSFASPPTPPQPVAAGQPVTLTAAASDSGINLLSYSWDFGDGTTGMGASVTHTYASAGLYTATVTVSNGVNTTSATVLVAVDAAGVSTDPTNSWPRRWR